MTAHKLHLHARPFELIMSGNKTIEARLNDERRQRIEIGDTITFINREGGQTLEVTVHKLLRAPTFHDLFQAHDPLLFGAESIEHADSAMEKYYDYNDQLKYGVIGIEFVVGKKK